MLHLGRLVFAAAVLATPAGAQSAQSPTPVGVWLHDNKRIEIEISPCGDRLCAKLVWFRWPDDAQGLPLVDVKNVDPALRSRPLLGLAVLYGLRRTGDNLWEDGQIYDPDDGVNYAATMSIEEDGTLRIRAYMLVPLFGHTLVWTRVRCTSAHSAPASRTLGNVPPCGAG